MYVCITAWEDHFEAFCGFELSHLLIPLLLFLLWLTCSTKKKPHIHLRALITVPVIPADLKFTHAAMCV